jgi:hypothetical protein
MEEQIPVEEFTGELTSEVIQDGILRGLRHILEVPELESILSHATKVMRGYKREQQRQARMKVDKALGKPTVLNGEGCTAIFDKEADPQTVEIREDFGGEVTVPVVFLAYILQEYGDFRAKTDTSEWRGTHGS